MNIQCTRPYNSTCRTQAVRKKRTGGPPSVQTSLRKAAQGDGRRGARIGPRISVLSAVAPVEPSGKQAAGPRRGRGRLVRWDKAL